MWVNIGAQQVEVHHPILSTRATIAGRMFLPARPARVAVPLAPRPWAYKAGPRSPAASASATAPGVGTVASRGWPGPEDTNSLGTG